MRRRPAPMAARTASSCCRSVPRASSRMETLAQPISSREATAPRSRYSVGPRGRVNLDDTSEIDAKLFGIARRRLLGEFFDDRLKLRVGLGSGYPRAEFERSPKIDVGILRDFPGKVDVSLAPLEARRHHAHNLVTF